MTADEINRKVAELKGWFCDDGIWSKRIPGHWQTFVPPYCNSPELWSGLLVEMLELGWIIEFHAKRSDEQWPILAKPPTGYRGHTNRQELWFVGGTTGTAVCLAYLAAKEKP